MANRLAWVALSLFPGLATPPATAATQRPVAADNVRVRTGPGQEYAVTGALRRGAELSLLKAGEPDGYCQIEGDGFYAAQPWPRERASVVETTVKLDRAATGFVRGTYLHYDFDGDAVTDLAIFEGQGRGPGHLDGPTLTDDRWYRLALVNINGAWKVPGSDAFGYGGGC